MPQAKCTARRLLYLSLVGAMDGSQEPRRGDEGDRELSNGIWTAASGAAAQSQAVEMVANNLANSDTLAFKKDTPTFKDYLAIQQREHGALDIPRGPIKEKEFYPLDGRDQTYVIVDGTYSNFKQGSLKVTQAPLDVAIDGPGFLEVSTPSGIRYTRQGSLKVATDGRLVTSDGNPVLASTPGGLAAAPTPNQQQDQGRQDPALGAQGRAPAGLNTQDVAARFINLRDRGSNNLNINQQGEIYSGEDLIGKLSLVEFTDVNKLRKQGGSLYENQDAANQPINPGKTLLHQGMLETSNVNPVEEMTNLIKANRLFEEDLKSMKTYGEMMGREVNDLGKL
jgi:flagellar basal-body rod protein FlgF